MRCIETTLSYASVMGIKKDLNLEGDQYQWLGSLFYFGMFHLLFSSGFILLRDIEANTSA
jgi:ACS family allantoate permease-like MFS transporter